MSLKIFQLLSTPLVGSWTASKINNPTSIHYQELDCLFQLSFGHFHISEPNFIHFIICYTIGRMWLQPSQRCTVLYWTASHTLLVSMHQMIYLLPLGIIEVTTSMSVRKWVTMNCLYGIQFQANTLIVVMMCWLDCQTIRRLNNTLVYLFTSVDGETRKLRQIVSISIKKNIPQWYGSFGVFYAC